MLLGAVWWATGPSGAGALGAGAAFAAALLGFFVAHEAGHWVAARRHGVAIGPPLFLPIGVVMHLREAPASRRALLDLGAAGPLAGTVALAVLLVARLGFGGPMAAADPRLELSGSLLWWLVAAPLGAGPPSAADPVAAAFCVGCLVTALNLLPFGQLDGGHVAAALWPSHASRLSWAVTALLLVAGLFWPGWAAWAAVIHLVGSRHALRPRTDGKHLTRRDRLVALAAAVAFLLCVTPAPIR